MKANRLGSVIQVLTALACSSPLFSAQAADDKLELPGIQMRGDKIKVISPSSKFVGAIEGLCAPVGTEMRIVDVKESGVTVVVTGGPDKQELRDKELLNTQVCKGPMVEINGSYKISLDDYKSFMKHRKGWTYGAMMVPFKYYFKDRKFESSQTIGTYFGWRQSPYDWMGISYVASAGISNLKVTNKDTQGSSNVMGYTFAAGVLFDLTKEARPFVAGLLIGRDYYGKDALLPDIPRHKTWFAFQLGFEM